MPLKFVNWEWRPAVLTPTGAAFAVLTPRVPWSRVDAVDVSWSGAVMSEAVWRRTFEPEFGALDVSKIPQVSPSSARVRT